MTYTNAQLSGNLRLPSRVFNRDDEPMISTFNSGSATLRRILLITALAACSLITGQTAIAQSTAMGSLTQTGTGLSTFSITSNQTFQLTLMVNNNFMSGGITYFLMVSNNGSGLFRMTARDATLS